MTSSIDVLVIEDDRWLGEQFARVLKKTGFTVSVTSNGHSAIDMIDTLQPRVLFMDMLLPGATALTLLQELQSYNDTAAIPVILCTNLAPHITIQDTESYGVRRILDKATMHPDDVVAAVRSVLI